MNASFINFLAMFLMNVALISTAVASAPAADAGRSAISVSVDTYLEAPLSPMSGFPANLPADIPCDPPAERPRRTRKISLSFLARMVRGKSSRQAIALCLAYCLRVSFEDRVSSLTTGAPYVNFFEASERAFAKKLFKMAGLCLVGYLLGSCDIDVAGVIGGVTGLSIDKNSVQKHDLEEKLELKLQKQLRSISRAERHLVFPSVRFVENGSRHMSCIVSTSGRYNAALVAFTELHEVPVEVGDIVVVESDKETKSFNDKVAQAMVGAGYICLTQGLWVKQKSVVTMFYQDIFQKLFGNSLMEIRSYGKGISSTPAIETLANGKDVVLAVVSIDGTGSYKQGGLIRGTDGGCLAGEIMHRRGFQFRACYEEGGLWFFGKGLSTRAKYVLCDDGSLVAYDTLKSVEWGVDLKSLKTDDLWYNGCAKTGGKRFTFKWVGLNSSSFKGLNKKKAQVGIINDDKAFISVLAADDKIGNQKNDLTWQDVMLNSLVKVNEQWVLRENIKACYRRVLSKKLFGREMDAKEFFKLVTSTKLNRLAINSGITLDAQYCQMAELGQEIAIMATPSTKNGPLPFANVVFKRQPQQTKASNAFVKAINPSALVSLLDKVIASGNVDGKVLTDDFLDFYNRLNADFKVSIQSLEMFREEVKGMITPSVVQKTIWISNDLAGLVNADNDGDYLLFSFDHDIIMIIKDQLSVGGVDNLGNFVKMVKVKNESSKNFIYKESKELIWGQSDAFEVSSYLNAPNGGQGAIGAVINAIGGLVSKCHNYNDKGEYMINSDLNRVVETMWLVAQEVIDWQKYKYYLASLLYWHQWDRKSANPNFNYVVAGKTTKSTAGDASAAYEEIKSFDPSQWVESLPSYQYGKMVEITDVADGYSIAGINLFTFWIVNLHKAYENSTAFQSFEQVWIDFLNSQAEYLAACEATDKKDALAKLIAKKFKIDSVFILDGNYSSWCKAPLGTSDTYNAQDFAAQAKEVRTLILELVENKAKELGLNGYMVNAAGSIKVAANGWLNSEDHKLRMNGIVNELNRNPAFRINNVIKGESKEVSQTQILALLKQVKDNSTVVAVERKSSIAQSQRTQTKESNSPSNSLREVLGGLSVKVYHYDDSGFADLNYVRVGLLLLLQNGHANQETKHGKLMAWEYAAFELVKFISANPKNGNEDEDKALIEWLLGKFIPSLHQAGENNTLLAHKQKVILGVLNQLFNSAEYKNAGSVQELVNMVLQAKKQVLDGVTEILEKDIKELSDDEINLSFESLGVFDNCLRFLNLNQARKIELIKKGLRNAIIEDIRTDGAEFQVIKSRFEMAIPEEIRNDLVCNFIKSGLSLSVNGQVVSRLGQPDADIFEDGYYTRRGYIYLEASLLNSGVGKGKYTQENLREYIGEVFNHGFGCAGNGIFLDAFLKDQKHCSGATAKVLNWIKKNSVRLSTDVKLDEDLTLPFAAYFTPGYFVSKGYGQFFKPSSAIGKVVRKIVGFTPDPATSHWYNQDCANYINEILCLPTPKVGATSDEERARAKELNNARAVAGVRSYQSSSSDGEKASWSGLNKGFNSPSAPLNRTTVSLVDCFDKMSQEHAPYINASLFDLLPLLGIYSYMGNLLCEMQAINAEQSDEEDVLKAAEQRQIEHSKFDWTVSSINIWSLKNVLLQARKYESKLVVAQPNFSRSYLRALGVDVNQD